MKLSLKYNLPQMQQIFADFFVNYQNKNLF